MLLLPEAICCSLQTSTYCCFYQGGEIYVYVYKLSLIKKHLNYMDTSNALTMYCQRLFLLFTGNNIVYIIIFMTIMESGWNVWLWLVGVVSRR